VAARVMRGILVDHARREGTAKHGGNLRRITLHEGVAVSPRPGPDEVDILALDEVLRKLRELDERKGRIVEMRFFGGMSIEQTAAVLGIARSTVAEEWRMARAWVARALLQERSP
jgi:RNA polymerase sigma-70 factor, ECF subfamily